MISPPALSKQAPALFAALLSGVASLCAADVNPQAERYEKVVKPFFEQHCTECHGEDKQKGKLRVDTLTLDLKASEALNHWTEIMNRINSGDMPPKDEPRAKAEDIAQVADWITSHLTEADAVAKAGGGEAVSFRRLTREEYGNTIHDLLGVTYDATAPTALPEDPDWQGFQRISSVLSIAPAHIEKYMSAAEAALDEALALNPQPKKELIEWTPYLLRPGWQRLQKGYVARGIADKVRVDIVPNNGANGTPGENNNLLIKATGDYLVRMKFSAMRPVNGIPPRLRVYIVDLDRVIYEHDVEAPEDKPMTVEVRAHLPAGNHPVRILNAVPGPGPTERHARPTGAIAYTSLKTRQPWQIKLTKEDFTPAVPIILLDSVEWEGPIHPVWPTVAHQEIFFGGEQAEETPAYAREILFRFATHAWRRPATASEVDRLVHVVEQSQKLGENFKNSVRSALLAILCSKNLIYLQEGSTVAPSPRLTSFELASRLSYFLWSTMPDARLMEVANNGKLLEPEILRAEVQRMMRDPKIATFAESFPRQWLQLRRVGMFPPDKKLYPDYDEYLEKSMITETTAFFGEVLKKNLSLREFLSSDWTMLNRRLAGFYDIPNVEGEEMQRVVLKPEEHRGGLLTQASILSLTSDGTRHRPVHRGKWILESIIGKPPPPPPPNVSAIQPTPSNQPKTSLREKLAAHLADPSCASCHKKIDPLGIALENFDAIGRWRTEETMRDGSGANPKIDASGVLADGRAFPDAAGLKQILASDLDPFSTAFTEKLATYALRRGMTFTDRLAIAALAKQCKGEAYPLSSLIEKLATSDFFQQR